MQFPPRAFAIGISLYVSVSESVIDIIIKTGNLRIVLVECHQYNYYDTPLSSLLILLVHVDKFNVHDTSITLSVLVASQRTSINSHRKRREGFSSSKTLVIHLLGATGRHANHDQVI